jgi:methanogenic corrinoid protein MtbC1
MNELAIRLQAELDQEKTESKYLRLAMGELSKVVDRLYAENEHLRHRLALAEGCVNEAMDVLYEMMTDEKRAEPESPARCR